MPPLDINDLGLVGVVTDVKPYMLTPEAFSTALNMRVVDGGIQRIIGWEQTFGPLPVAPSFVLAMNTLSQALWIYTSLTKAYVWDGTAHTDITRVSGDYTVGLGDSQQWNGTLLGGVPILNNGSDIPQTWIPFGLPNKLVDLPNWATTPTGGATLRAKVIRAFGPYLVAIGISKSANSFPHMVKWSHPADPGSVPISWDETDPTKDCGEVELPDVKAGIIVDMLPLSESMYIYKESSVWKMRFVGGRFIFDLGKSAWLPTTGILGPRCVCVTGDGTRHVWASQDDILYHDGNRVKSLLTARRRRELFNALDTQYSHRAFIFDNPLFGEVWFCYPSSGNQQPNKALVLNYMNGGDSWPITDVDGITFRWAETGPIQDATDEIWDEPSTITVTWEIDDGPWARIERRRVVLCGTDATKFYTLDKGGTKDGTGFNGILQRLGFSVLGKKRNGDWIVDFNQQKMFDQFWPRLTQGPVQVRFGAQDLVDGPVRWNDPVVFDPTRQLHCYPGPVSGAALAYEISAATHYHIDGFTVDVVALGTFGGSGLPNVAVLEGPGGPMYVPA